MNRHLAIVTIMQATVCLSVICAAWVFLLAVGGA